MSTTSNRADYPVDLVHRLIEPGPVILISTAYRGESNLMTNGFNMPIGHGGPIGVVLGPWDHSYTALDRTGECVLGVPSADLMETVVAIGNVTGADIDKWTQYGLTPDPAKEVTAPLVRECFANIECRVRDRRLVADYPCGRGSTRNAAARENFTIEATGRSRPMASRWTTRS
jgi:flavin reductase (DIM6/NTAB) family NADH-FMN oxidoreductase RutF